MSRHCPRQDAILAALRERDGMTMRELADLFGIAQKTVHRAVVGLSERREAHIAKWVSVPYAMASVWVAGAGTDAVRPPPAVKAFKRIGHGRAKVACALRDGGPMTVTEITEAVGICRRAVVYHLDRLAAERKVYVCRYDLVGRRYTRVFSFGQGRTPERPAGRERNEYLREWRDKVKQTAAGADLQRAWFRPSV